MPLLEYWAPTPVFVLVSNVRERILPHPAPVRGALLWRVHRWEFSANSLTLNRIGTEIKPSEPLRRRKSGRFDRFFVFRLCERSFRGHFRLTTGAARVFSAPNVHVQTRPSRQVLNTVSSKNLTHPGGMGVGYEYATRPGLRSAPFGFWQAEKTTLLLAHPLWYSHNVVKTLVAFR